MKRPLPAILLLVLCCALCNLLSPLIDTPAMRAHASRGCLQLCGEGATPQLIPGYKISQADNFTAVLILKTAAYTGGEQYLKRAFGGFRTELPAAGGEDAWAAFCRYADGRESETGGLSYSRYWHGYTLPLRLLLCLLDFGTIRLLVSFAQLALAAGLVLALLRRGLARILPAFLAAFLLTVPPVTGQCVQFAPVSLLSLAGCLAVLLREERTGLCLFAALGVLTSYFDLLTAPTLTLTLPLVCLLALRLRRGEGFRPLLSRGLLCCLAWGLGYAGMWALKWALNALLFGSGYAAGIFSQIALRLSGESHGVRFTRLQALYKNLYLYAGKRPVLALLAAAALLSLLPGIKEKARGIDPRALALLLPAAAAVGWMLMTPNHIHDHSYYACRNLCGAVFAGLAALACLRAPKPR